MFGGSSGKAIFDDARGARDDPGGMPTVTTRRSLAWAGYAAFAWAIAYAIGVRGYQGLGGTLAAQSAPGCGTEMRLTLPAAPPAPRGRAGYAGPGEAP